MVSRKCQVTLKGILDEAQKVFQLHLLHKKNNQPFQADIGGSSHIPFPAISRLSPPIPSGPVMGLGPWASSDRPPNYLIFTVWSLEFLER
ncbi:hypothetical protein RND71_025024 [Anisodus tanguticus]|uniref:Uncharacterized protein n=1 Tax=Anisodus tanguticus TaxID=243964 RepID=A0AAE1RQM8_9SOLA|nr:hypothetical protein RND71_025024 [Anisodus tanguticus]